MAGFSVEKYLDAPIIILTITKSWTFKEAAATAAAVMQLLDEQEEPVFYIVDVTDEPPLSFNELVLIASSSTRVQTALLHHPNMRAHLMVAHNPALKLAAEGLNSEVYGRVTSKAFDTLAEALAFAQASAADIS